MNYFVLDQQGNRYGPADIATLDKWVAEGRIVPTTILVDAATGQQVRAMDVPMLQMTFAQNPQMPGSQFPAGHNVPSAFNQYPRGYGQNPYPAPGYGSGEYTASLVLSGFSMICCGGGIGMVTSILALVLAVMAKQKGHPNARTAMFVAFFALGLVVLMKIIGFGAMQMFRNGGGFNF
ncbi:MAG: hypothetical protein JSS72_04210 [Armatimonadetes bacterium]|nr:hypothetical protein [Armatimonadota bacterium]